MQLLAIQGIKIKNLGMDTVIRYLNRGKISGILHFRSFHTKAVSARTEINGFLPESPSYFMSDAKFNDQLLNLEKVEREASALPRLPPEKIPSASWIKIDQFKKLTNDSYAKPSQLKRITNILSRLNGIEYSLLSEEAQELLSKYQRTKIVSLNKKRENTVDKDGKVFEVGKRKTSVAKVWVIRGTGEIVVNGRRIFQYFDKPKDRDSVLWPLVATNTLNLLNIWAIADGGGPTGQADAIQHAISKAILTFYPKLKPILRKGTTTYKGL